MAVLEFWGFFGTDSGGGHGESGFYWEELAICEGDVPHWAAKDCFADYLAIAIAKDGDSFDVVTL